jgi:glucokinase
MHGCWESVASGTAIAAAGKRFGFPDSRSVFDAAPADPRAAAIVKNAVNATATAAWTIFHTFLPRRILLGGGLGEAHFDSFAPAIRQQISLATQFSNRSVEILKAQLGNGAGVIGAACLALQPTSSAQRT